MRALPTHLGVLVLTCYLFNPYPLESGHYAGFEWALNHNVTSCYPSNNSDSFLSGCLEYLRQKAECAEGSF